MSADQKINVTGLVCPQCDMDAEIYRHPDGSIQCEVCGWFLAEVPDKRTEK